MPSSSDSLTIQGPEKLPDTVNFRVLQKLGLDAIIETGSEQWTDYNEHDPGITILEILSLAVADLSYRSSFSIEDILSIAPDGENASEFFPDQFHAPSTILSSSPVTTSDLRKIIIDNHGVDNAWVEPLILPKRPSKDCSISSSIQIQPHNNLWSRSIALLPGFPRTKSPNSPPASIYSGLVRETPASHVPLI